MTQTDSNARVRTISIDVSRQCPSLEPISGPYRHGGKLFAAEALTIAGAAIDAGMFYETDTREFCREAWSALHPAQDTCLTLTAAGEYQAAPQTTASRRDRLAELDQALRVAARGTWFLLRLDWTREDQNGGTTWYLHIADGCGGVHDVQTGPIWHNQGRAPNYTDALEAMERREIYDVVNAERERREEARSRAVVKANGWIIGQKLRNVEVSGTKYSTGTINMLLDNGSVEIVLRKRGSPKAWAWRGLAQKVKGDGVLPTLPAYGQLVATEAA